MTSEEIEIAPLTDADALARLHALCFERAWTAESFEALVGLPGTCALGGLLNQKPAGFILARQAADEAEVLTIGVVETARRKGVARALFRAALAQMTGLHALYIEVDVANVDAIKFYEALRFQTSGRRAGYYRHADGTVSDALIMRYEVGSSTRD